MSSVPPFDWEQQYPNTAALLKTWGVSAPVKKPAGVAKAAPAAAFVPEPKVTQTTPAGELGIRIHETVKKAVTENPMAEFTAGFGEGLWTFAKSVPALAGMAAKGLWLGVSDPATATKALGSLASEAYQALRGVDTSTLPASARPIVVSALKSFEESPSRASGRLVSEALLLVAPGKMMGAAKSMMKALPTVGRGARAAAPVIAEAAAPLAEAAAPAAARGSQMQVVVEKAAAEEAASRKAVSAALKPVGKTKLLTKPGKPVLKLKVPESAQQPAPPPPSIAPAPAAPAPALAPVAAAPAQAPGVEEALVQRLIATGLTREESMVLITRNPKEIQRRLQQAAMKARVTKKAPAAETVAEPVQAAPGAPDVVPTAAAQPSIAPAAALVPELPVVAAPLKVPRPKKAKVQLAPADVTAADAAAEAVKTAEKAALRERLIAKARAKKAALAGSVAEVAPATIPEPLMKVANTVEELIYGGTTEKNIIKGMRQKLKALGVASPSEFIAQVRQVREIPSDLGAFVEKAGAFRAARRKAVTEAPAVEIAPLAPEELAAHRAATAEAGGKDFMPDPDTMGLGGIGGAAEVKRLKMWHSLEEMGERIFRGFGDSLVRIRTIKEGIFAPIKTRLSNVGFRNLNPRGVEDRNMYEAFLGREAPKTQVVAQAIQEVRDMQARLGQGGVGDFFRVLRSAIDPGKVESMTAPQIANLWVKRIPTSGMGVSASDAMKAAEQLKKMVEAGQGTSAFFRSGNFLFPPYEIMRPMKHAIPLYLERGAMKAGINGVFGSEAVMRRSISMTAGKHPDHRYFEQMMDQFLGYGRPVSETVRQMRDIGRLANAVAVTVLTPITAVKQLSQTAFSAMNLPLRDAIAGFGKMMTVEGWRGARAQGALLTEARELTGTLLGELDDATRIGRWAEVVSERVAAPVVHYTGIEAVDNLARGFAYWARKSELDRLLKAAKAGNLGAERRLIKAGVNLQAPSLSDEIKMVSKEFADKFNLRSDVLSSPALLSQPEYQMMRGLQMFAVNMTKLLYKEIIHPTIRPESFNAFLEQMLKNARLAGYGTLVGVVVNRTENFIKGREQPQNIAAELAGALAALGALGVWDRALNGLVDKNGNLLPLEEWPLNLLKQSEKIVTSFGTGAGPSIIAGMPRKFFTKPVSLLPGIGSILQSWIDKSNE